MVLAPSTKVASSSRPEFVRTGSATSMSSSSASIRTTSGGVSDIEAIRELKVARAETSISSTSFTITVSKRATWSSEIFPEMDTNKSVMRRKASARCPIPLPAIRPSRKSICIRFSVIIQFRPRTAQRSCPVSIDEWSGDGFSKLISATMAEIELRSGARLAEQIALDRVDATMMENRSRANPPGQAGIRYFPSHWGETTARQARYRRGCIEWQPVIMGMTDAADFAGFWLRQQRIGTRGV